MKISVITISFNAVSCIERTIRSVIHQTYTSFEYIVVDGGSSDGTTKIIEKYDKYISKWVSEKDKGIYNAMNKATGLATGEYCIYLNSGDMFVNKNVLSEAARYLDGYTSICTGNQIDIINNCIVGYDKSEKAVDSLFFFGRALCHQATFFLRNDVLLTPYDESYRMISDWKLETELLIKQNKKYKSIPIDICYFVLDGLTYTCRDNGRKEREVALKELFDKKELVTLQEKRQKYLSKTNHLHRLDGIKRKIYFIIKKIQYFNDVKKMKM